MSHRILESRSVRLSDEHWDLAAAIALVFGKEGAAEGLRIALYRALDQIVCEGDGDYGAYLCPGDGTGDHVFVWADGDGSKEPPAGEMVMCMGDVGNSGRFCGYSFLWRGVDALAKAQNRVRAGRESKRVTR